MDALATSRSYGYFFSNQRVTRYAVSCTRKFPVLSSFFRLRSLLISIQYTRFQTLIKSNSPIYAYHPSIIVLVTVHVAT